MGYKIYKNFLSSENLNIVTEESSLIFNSKYTRYLTNFTLWEDFIVKDSNVVLIYPLTPDNSKSYNLLLKQTQSQLNLTPESIMFYYWTSGSYIPWHNDGHKKQAGTLYLNENWNEEWGGLYLAKETDKNHIIYPEYNSFTLQFDNMEHSTTPTTKFAPLRVTVQLFFS